MGMEREVASGDCIALWKKSPLLKLATLFMGSFSPFPSTALYPWGFPFLFSIQEVPSTPLSQRQTPLASGLGASRNEFRASASYIVVCTLTRLIQTLNQCNCLQGLHAYPLVDLGAINFSPLIGVLSPPRSR